MIASYPSSQYTPTHYSFVRVLRGVSSTPDLSAAKAFLGVGMMAAADGVAGVAEPPTAAKRRRVVAAAAGARVILALVMAVVRAASPQNACCLQCSPTLAVVVTGSCCCYRHRHLV
jgi:hypothetical protein